MINAMDVSIIIVNFKTFLLTKNCIESIIAKTFGVEYEIILVDNASSDGSQEFFANDARIKFIEAGRNLGFGKANNLGVQQAKGDYIFFLNSDTLLLNNAIYEMCAIVRNIKKIILEDWGAFCVMETISDAILMPS